MTNPLGRQGYVVLMEVVKILYGPPVKLFTFYYTHTKSQAHVISIPTKVEKNTISQK